MSDKLVVWGVTRHAGISKDSVGSWVSSLPALWLSRDVERRSTFTNDVKLVRALAEEVLVEHALGVVVCSDGMMGSVVANKIKGIVAVRCLSILDAVLARQKHHANLLCLAAATDPAVNASALQAFVATPSGSDETHHEQRYRINRLDTSHCDVCVLRPKIQPIL